MAYMLYDEDGEKMRVVHKLEEAKEIIKTRADWTYKFFKKPVKVFDLNDFEEAPF